MDKNVMSMLQTDVINKELTYNQIIDYIKRLRSAGKLVGISDSEIFSYLDSKMYINITNNEPARPSSSFDMNTKNSDVKVTAVPRDDSGIFDDKNDTTTPITEPIKPSTVVPENSTRSASINPSNDPLFWERPKEELRERTINLFSSGSKTNSSGKTVYEPIIVGDCVSAGKNKFGQEIFTPQYGTLPEGEEYYNPLQLKLNGDPKVSDIGRVQIKFDFGNANGARSMRTLDDCTLTFTPSNGDSMHRLVTVFPGSGGWGSVPTLGVDSNGKPIVNSGVGYVDDYYLNTDGVDSNCTILRLPCYIEDSGISEYIPHILDELNQEFSNGGEGYQNRYTFAAASDGTVQMFDAIRAVVDDRVATNSTNHTPIDIMLLDAKGNGQAGGAAQPFVDEMNEPKNAQLKSELIRTGSIVYAYEAKGGLTRDPREAINNLGVLTEDGMIIVDVENNVATEHAKTNSHEFQYTSGALGKTAYGFNDSVDVDGITLLSNGKNEAENRYYLVIPKDSWDPTKKQNYYDQRQKVTEKQLNAFCEYREIKGVQSEDGKYLKDLIGYVESENKETGKYVNLSSGVSLSDDNVLFDFQGVIDSANGVVTEINGTRFKNSGFDYQFCQDSTADFPESLNMANAFLYGVSNTLLGVTAKETENIEQILNDFIYLDNKYAGKAESMMNGAYNDGKYFTTDVDVNSTNVEGAARANVDIFQVDIEKGHVGKIAMSDIDGMLSGSGLSGRIGENLKNEREDAWKLESKINEMLSMGQNVVMGDVWDAEKKRLEMLSNACKLRAAAADTLETAYLAALKNIKDYYDETAAMIAGSKIDMGGALDDGQIPVCENTIEVLKAEIEELRTEYDVCQAVPPIRGTGEYYTDEKGNKCEVTEPNEPEYTNARNRMKEISTVEIPERNQEINYNNMYIAQLEKFASVVEASNKIVQDAIDQVNSDYASFVNDIPEVTVGHIEVI